MFLGDKNTDGKLNGLDVTQLLADIDIAEYNVSNVDDLTQGVDPRDTITETSSPKAFNFSGDSGRDLHDKTDVTISNGSTASATEDITVELYDGSDTTGTLLTSETQSVTVSASSTTTVTFITGDVALDNGTYHININQSGTTFTIDQTDESTKGATYTFGQTATGDLYLRDQDGSDRLRVNSLGAIEFNSTLDMGSTNQIRSSATEYNDALIDANMDSSTSNGDWFHIIEFDDAGGADEIAWARHASKNYAWYVHNQTQGQWLSRVSDDGNMELPNGNYYAEGKPMREHVDGSFDGTNGWYRIASNGPVADGQKGGDRATGRFTVYDTDGGDHHAITFMATVAYGEEPTITVLSAGNYGGVQGLIHDIRLVYGDTYEGAAVEVLLDGDNGNVETYLHDNVWESGWTLENFTSGSVPTGFSTVHAQIDNNNSAFSVSTQNGNGQFSVNHDGGVNINGNPVGGEVDIGYFGVGASSVTTGFKPRYIEFTANVHQGTWNSEYNAGNNNNASNDLGYMHGFATPDGTEMVTSYSDNSDSVNDHRSFEGDSYSIYIIKQGGSSAGSPSYAKGNVSSFDSNGFSLSWADTSYSSTNVIYRAYK